nr:PREDICTED: protein unc-79 homolog isoform X2 [Bemisia tabaci]
MATRAAAFTAKVRNLHDHQLRLLHSIVPVPSGCDVANTLKYFTTTLLTVMKDVPKSPLVMLKHPEEDAARMALFPSLDYKGLYNAVVQLIDVAPLVQFGLQAMGEATLHCLGCIMPFLERDQIDSLPYVTSLTMAVFPRALHQKIVNALCFYVLPFTIARIAGEEKEGYISQSLAAVIMMVFQYSEDMAHHCQLLECLMGMKQLLVKDLLCVMAYGTSNARASAAKLLFYYWPTFNSSLFERKGAPPRVTNDWTPFACQRDQCPNVGTAEAAKVCFDHCISITYSSDTPPPLYLCIECANEIHREHPNQMFYDILHPMQQVSVSCENKSCRSADKSVVSLCFSTECASYNANHPIRYCQQCHNSRHNNRRGGDHIVHTCLSSAWQMDMQMRNYLIEAIISLMKEARPTTPEIPKDMTDIQAKAALLNVLGHSNQISVEERQLMGRFGVLLLVGLCVPDKETPVEVLGRLLSMLFHWFHVTAYSFDDQAECTLERLKTDYVCSWLNTVCETHFKVFISCLLPHPADYARVGGHWDMHTTRTAHLKNGLNRLFCLVPYEVISSEIWDEVMPFWMEAIVKDVPDKDLCELKMLLSKILDPDMSPLGFDAKKMYHFVAVRFKKTSPKVQEQALAWLQVLTALEIVIPLHLLFSFFEDGISSLKEHSNSNGEQLKKSKLAPVYGEGTDHVTPEKETLPGINSPKTDPELTLSCSVFMLDIILRQMELHEVERHTGIHTVVAQDVCRLLQDMLSASWLTFHKCTTTPDFSECSLCEILITWHQLCLELVEYIAQENLAHPPDPPLEEAKEEESSIQRKSPPDTDKKCDSKSEVAGMMQFMDIPAVGGVLVNMPHIMTATVETVVEQLDLAPIILPERVIPPIARAVTLTHSDSATNTARVRKPTLVSETEEQLETEDMENFWHTSVGKFRFVLTELPQQFQFIHQLLKELPTVESPDVLYYMLQCLYRFVLHGDALNKALKDHRGFIVWCQENLLIRNLWELCNAENSHICEVCVPILLHCISLPVGSDVFWKVIQDDFHSSDWKVRFAAVERVTVIARFMDSTPLRNNLQLQAALANAFCYLICSLDDINVYTAQRATLFMGTIHDSAIKSLILCFETQFDTLIVDRPMVLQSLYQLHNCLSDRHILSWEFFLNRFDALFIEAQINLEKTGEISYLRDLRNSDLTSEVLIKKLHRAQEALLIQSDTSSAKTLSASFGPKWPYKRTMSAPASMLSRQDYKLDKEKQYSRQYSAPILKRKSSRFGMGQCVASVPNNPPNLSSQLQPDGHLYSLNLNEETDSTITLHRIIELEEADKETIHLLIFLLMQFLSRSDQAFPSEEKGPSRTQLILLRHLYLLLGYNQSDRIFHMSAERMRCSASMNAFLSCLPQVLDQNHLMGKMLLPTSLLLLQHFISPAHTLWLLEPYARRSWLMTMIVLFYKYDYSSEPLFSEVMSIIKIVMNTIESQHHVCRHIPPTVIMPGPPSRSRDTSQPLLGIDNDGGLSGGTPPFSPGYSASDCGLRPQVGSVHEKGAGSMETHWEEDFSHDQEKDKRPPHIHDSNYSSTEAEETESELAVIPASIKSDSTAQGSSQGSFEEVPDEEAKKKVEISGKTRPTWFLGSEDHSVQSQPSSANGKRGIREGMKMLVASSLFGVGRTSESSQAPPQPPPSAPIMPRNTSASPSTPKFIDKEPVMDWTDSFVTRQMALKPAHHPKCNIDHTVMITTPPWQLESLHGKNKFPPSSELKPPQIVSRNNSIASKTVPPRSPIPKEEVYESPESPLSKMDVHMVGWPSDKDQETGSKQSVSPLELPAPERLLPIGAAPVNREGMVSLVRHVSNVLGISNSNDSKTSDASLSGTISESLSTSPLPKQDSLDKPISQSSTSVSPRRLIKQVALESPPPQLQDSVFSSVFRSEDSKNYRQPLRKSTSPHSLSAEHSKRPEAWNQRNHTPLDPAVQFACHAATDLKLSASRTGDECVINRCGECGTALEEYSEEELGLCIVILGTFIHREPALAAPLLPHILITVGKMATWHGESTPKGATSVARQFLRCVLHQLAPNGIFVQMFHTHVSASTRHHFFRSVAQALHDFNELNPVAPLQLLFESLNSRKSLVSTNLKEVLANVACYLDCLPLEIGLGCAAWSGFLTQLDLLLRKLPTTPEASSLLRIMNSVLKVPGIPASKSLLEPFTKILSYSIQNSFLKYNTLVDICFYCYRGYSREREKLMLTRTVIFELVQALKFKITIPDSNFLVLISFILQDVGGVLPQAHSIEQGKVQFHEQNPILNTGAAECMRQHLADALEFLADFHTLSKIKSYGKDLSAGLNEDTLGGTLKAGIAQYVALEMTRGTSRDSRAVARYLPWLYTAPPTVVQSGPRDLNECINGVRLASWLLLGSLTHCALQMSPCLPIPQEASCHVADYIQQILLGFIDQSKTSVIHMSSLFHAFVLCQLWTVYMEQYAEMNPPRSEAHSVSMSILFDFWSKITSTVLQLVSFSKMMAEMINLHFLSLLEALLEVHSSVLSKLLPIWTPILFAHHIQLPGHLQLRLQNCCNFPPTSPSVAPSSPDTSEINPVSHNLILVRWLNRLQFKMGQIELQSSTATQFYSV